MSNKDLVSFLVPYIKAGLFSFFVFTHLIFSLDNYLDGECQLIN